MKYSVSFLAVAIACLLPSRMVVGTLLAGFALFAMWFTLFAYSRGAMNLQDEMRWFNDSRKWHRLADNTAKVPVGLIYLLLFLVPLFMRFVVTEANP